jgi:hypothetical protein
MNYELLLFNNDQISLSGANIFKLMDELLSAEKIPWKNCISFGCDNASVMTGVHKGVFAFIKKKNPDCYLSGCTLHLVHLASEKAAAKLPFCPADLLVNIYYYMKSSVRQANLKKWQEEFDQQARGVLKHVSTRWLSIGRCLERLCQDWKPLREFFREEKTKAKDGTAAHEKASSISEKLNSHTARLYCLFLNDAVMMFEPFLTHNQAEAPLIHSLLDSMKRLLKHVLIKFIKLSAIAGKET